ncbi:MAG: alpha/beta fold hydrolase [Cyanobacteriota bacterium]|nr:alpha/beta fold hydrolase [Cyanobacteriota bacterium]
MEAPVSQPAPGSEGSGRPDWGSPCDWFWQDQRCHWRELGEPHHPALVLIHGFGAGSGHWRHNAEGLAAAGWRVFALDLIGFGSSSQPGPHPTLPLDNRLWARQLQGFLEQVVQGPAVLVGHSLGGLVALSCAVFFPGWVRAVVAAPLPDPALLSGDGSRVRRRRPWRRRLKRFVVGLLCRLLPLELLVPLIAHSPLLDLGIQSAYSMPVMGDEALRRVIARPARRPTAVRSLRAMSIAMALRPHAATAPALLERLRRPLLLVWGAQDRLVPLRVAQRVQEHRRDVPLEVIEGCGHCPHDERAVDFNRRVLAWLNRIEATRQPAEPLI